MGIFLSIALMVLGLFMVLLILLQRGRGGGLAGAFGGAGGQSAFGTKAGDVFTKITIGVAVVWVILNGGLGMVLRNTESPVTSRLKSEIKEGVSALPGDDKTKGAATDDKALPADTDKAGGTPDATSGEAPATDKAAKDTPPAEATTTPEAKPADAPMTETDPAATTPAAPSEPAASPAEPAAEKTDADAEQSKPTVEEAAKPTEPAPEAKPEGDAAVPTETPTEPAK